MITTITSFPLPRQLTIEQARESFLNAVPMLQAVPGLLKKQFLLAEDGCSAGGAYLWKDRASAEAFEKNILIDSIRQQFGVTPTVTYYDTPVILDNENDEVSSG